MLKGNYHELNNFEVIGNLLMIERKKQHISLREFSDQIDLSHTMISNIEKNKSVPSEDTLKKMVKVLNIDIFMSSKYEKDIEKFSEKIFDCLNHYRYEDALKILLKFESKPIDFAYSQYAIEYRLMRLFYYTIKGSFEPFLKKEIDDLSYVFDNLNKSEKQLLLVIQGLWFLYRDYYKTSAKYFEKAKEIHNGNKQLIPIINEYYIRTLIKQYKFTDATILANKTIGIYEESGNYLRAIRTKLSLANIHLIIKKLNTAMEIVNTVLKFAKKHSIVHLIGMAGTIKANILFVKGEYKDALSTINGHFDPKSRWVAFTKFRILLFKDVEEAKDYYIEIKNDKDILLSDREKLYIDCLYFWVVEKLSENKQYLKSLKTACNFAVEENDQELIGITYNLRIYYYKRKRHYKKAVELAKKFGIHKKLHISFMYPYLQNDVRNE
ncbi:MAG: helix-turn-helix transcriptional regulator [Candidatus Izimaplasma sp.]|nr:helix-turn-helix transcriptional regulator [Candidatus Izimaplasma bacterium]